MGVEDSAVRERSLQRRGSCLVQRAAALACWGLLAGGASAGPTRLQLEIQTPADGAQVADPGGTAFIAGRALALSGDFERFQIVFVIDRSQSTIAPSGADVNGDGETGRWGCDSTPPKVGVVGTMLGLCGESKDSVLAAELVAARTLLEQLDPRSTEVAVVEFSGDEDQITPDAEVVCPLTGDYDRVRQALARIAADGPEGFTNMQAAVQAAAGELLRARSGAGPQERAQKIILFLSDGQPTLPSPESSIGNRRLAIEAARQAAAEGMRIDSYGIGNDALSDPEVLVQLARVSGGVFTPVLRPGDLQSIFEAVSFSDIAELRIANRTNGSVAQQVLRNADGSFSALLDMVPGKNRVQIYARSSDGAEQTRTLTVQFSEGAQSQSLSPHLQAQRNRLLQNRLSELRERNLSVEVQRDEAVRRGLEKRIQEERGRADERLRRVGIKEAPCSPEMQASGACAGDPAPDAGRRR